MAYVGTQADKFNEATAAMNELLTTLPQSEKLFVTAKDGLKKTLASERISQDGIIFNYIKAQKLETILIFVRIYMSKPRL